MLPPRSLGIVGAGRLVERGYLPALSTSASFRLVAVADPDPVRRARVAELARCAGVAEVTSRADLTDDDGAHRFASVATYASSAALLEATAVDAIVVATPADRHVADGTVASAAGLPVLLEKPPAVDAGGAAALAALRRPPWIGFNRRFDAGAESVRRSAPAEGPVELDLRIHYRRSAWSAHVVRDDAWLDLGTHLVDLVRWIGSCEVIEVTRAALAPDHAEVLLRTTRGSATLVARTDRVHEERIALRDAAGRIIARHRRGGIAAGARARLTRRPSALVDSIGAQLDAFADAIATGGHATLATAEDGLAAMLVLDAARESADSHRPVALTPAGRT